MFLITLILLTPGIVSAEKLQRLIQVNQCYADAPNFVTPKVSKQLAYS